MRSNLTKIRIIISRRFPIPVRSTPVSVTTTPKPFPYRPQTTYSTTNKSTLVSSSLSLRRSSNFAGDEDPLPERLSPELMPRHVAAIMDRRWARKRGLTSGEGHVAGMRSLTRLVDLCARWRIKVLTVFAFSAENWARSKEEVETVMRLIEEFFESELQNFAREGVRISAIGDLSKLPKSLQNVICDTVESSKHNTGLQLIMAINYSGRYDVTQACQSIVRKTRDGVIAVEGIDEAPIERELETNCTEFPCPDLLIRTSGEVRVSNFLLWQLAYTELFFAELLWPDFGESEFVEVMASFQQRQRRLGGWERFMNNC